MKNSKDIQKADKVKSKQERIKIEFPEHTQEFLRAFRDELDFFKMHEEDQEKLEKAKTILKNINQGFPNELTAKQGIKAVCEALVYACRRLHSQTDAMNSSPPYVWDSMLWQNVLDSAARKLLEEGKYVKTDFIEMHKEISQAAWDADIDYATSKTHRG